MKCPLFYAAELKHEPVFTPQSSDCLQGECAWWDEDKNACSIKVIAKELTNIQLKLYHIASVMPFKATL